MNKKERESILSFVALVISLMAALFTCLQWWEARETRIDSHQDAVDARRMAADQFKIQREDAQEQSQIQEKDVTRAASAADRSAKAAEKSAFLAEQAQRTNRETFQISERARVSVKSMRLLPLEVGKPATAVVVIENFGKTPASQLAILHTLMLTREALNQDPREELPQAKPRSGVLMSSETVDVTSISNRTIGDDELAALNLGTLHMYVFGKLEYVDIFDHHHGTRFCGEYNRQAPETLIVCRHYVSAD